MSGNSTRRIPKYCRQREKGRADRAVVWIDGKRHILGAFDSDESRQKYRELVFGEAADEELAEPTSAEPTVAEVIAAYLDHAAEYYRKPDGSPGLEYLTIKYAMVYLRRDAADLLAEDFGPKRLKRVRGAMIDDGLTRKYINGQVKRIVRAFQHAVEEELIPPSIYQALAAVKNLQRGHCTAKETEPRRPVPDTVVDATIEHLPEVVADMVRIQRFTAMRAGELVQMRPCDIERSGDVWVYTPREHKTEHRGKKRAVPLGPKTQPILLKYLARADDMHLFRPCDSEAKRLAEREAKRTTPDSCGNTPGSNRVAKPKRKAGAAYTVDAYRRCITRAAKAAKVEHWTPHRLRHTAATKIRNEFGLEAAQVVLGHSHAAITEVYAETNQAKAVEVMRKIG